MAMYRKWATATRATRNSDNDDNTTRIIYNTQKRLIYLRWMTEFENEQIDLLICIEHEQYHLVRFYTETK